MTGEWQPRVAFVAREWTAKLGLVAAGLGVAVVPGLHAGAVREDVVLRRIRAAQPAVRTVSLVTRAAADHPPRVERFVDVLHDVAADLVDEMHRRARQRTR